MLEKSILLNRTHPRLVQIHSEYDKAVEMLEKTRGTKEHSKWLKIESDLNYAGEQTQMELGILVADPNPNENHCKAIDKTLIPIRDRRCHKCGGNKVKSGGFFMTQNGKVRRYKCYDCGACRKDAQ